MPTLRPIAIRALSRGGQDATHKRAPAVKCVYEKGACVQPATRESGLRGCGLHNLCSRLRGAARLSESAVLCGALLLATPPLPPAPCATAWTCTSHLQHPAAVAPVHRPSAARTLAHAFLRRMDWPPLHWVAGSRIRRARGLPAHRHQGRPAAAPSCPRGRAPPPPIVIPAKSNNQCVAPGLQGLPEAAPRRRNFNYG